MKPQRQRASSWSDDAGQRVGSRACAHASSWGSSSRNRRRRPRLAPLWLSGGDRPPGAFDNAEDFARHDVIGAARIGKPLGQGPVWLDAGESGPFLEATKELGGCCTYACTCHRVVMTLPTGDRTPRSTRASMQAHSRAAPREPASSSRRCSLPLASGA